MSETASARVEKFLSRIDALNPRFRAMTAVHDDDARQSARDIDARRDSGEWAGPLNGMIVAIKDNIDVAGHRCASGSRLFAEHRPDRDATVTARIRRAGGIVIGMASMMELAFGLRTTDALTGQCRNPWAADRVPGGSSGGTAASVALGFCDAALGTDTGGSVRMPAAFCGVTGLRPTLGRVSNRGVRPVSESLDTVGPMARTVGGVAQLYSVIAGFDPEDPHSLRRPVADWTRDPSDDVSGLRVGIPRNFYFDDLSPGIAESVMAVAQQFEAGGARLIEIDVPDAEIAHQYATRIILADACVLHAADLDARRDHFSDQVYERMIAGRCLSATDLTEAQRFRERWAHAARRRFDGIDATLFATTPIVAPPIEDNAHLADATRHATRFAYGGSLAGLPGLSIPCGDHGGLPIGALLESAPFAEDRLFRLGAHWQARTDWHRRTPPV